MATVQSVVRSFALLDEVAVRPRGLSELAEATGLPTSTAARLLATLADLDAVERDDDGRYGVGPMITGLVASGDLEPVLRDVAHPLMVELVAEVDEAVGLSIPVGEETVTIAQVDAPRAVQAEDWYGTRWPMLGGGSGFAIMSTWPPAEVERITARATAPDRVRADVARTRDEGVSWAEGDYVAELTSAAAPVVASSGRAIGALYVYGPSYRLSGVAARRRVEKPLRDTANRISRAWTGTPRPEG